jgi:hypothetical protein
MTENTASQSKPLFNLLHSSYKFILEAAVCALSAPCDLWAEKLRSKREKEAQSSQEEVAHGAQTCFFDLQSDCCR